MSASHPRLPSLYTFCLLLGVALGAHGQEWIGITEPFKDATISATVTGRIVAISTKPGDVVRAGAVLVQLDTTQEMLEVERRRLIAESTVELDSSRLRADALLVELESTRKLFQEAGSISEEEMLEKELEYKLALADVARLELSELREDIEQRMANAQLEERSVSAPFDGVVVEVLTEVGEMATPNQPLLRLVDVGRAKLVAYVDEAAAARLRLGQTVQLAIGDVQPLRTRGQIDFISPLVDSSSGLRKVTAVVSNQGGVIQPGLTGTLLIGR